MGESGERLCVLFVCSRNQWRSPTAEQLFRRDPRLSVRSAGTASSARHVVNAKDIAWAHMILAMEVEHKQRLRATFARLLQHKIIHVLEIPDDYGYMDADLVALLEEVVPPLLGLD